MAVKKRQVVIVNETANSFVGIRVQNGVMTDRGLYTGDGNEEEAGEIDYDPDKPFDADTVVNVAFMYQLRKTNRLEESVKDLCEADQRKTAEITKIRAKMAQIQEELRQLARMFGDTRGALTARIERLEQEISQLRGTTSFAMPPSDAKCAKQGW